MPFEYAFSSLSVDKSPPMAISPFGSINAEFHIWEWSINLVKPKIRWNFNHI